MKKTRMIGYQTIILVLCLLPLTLQDPIVNAQHLAENGFEAASSTTYVYRDYLGITGDQELIQFAEDEVLVGSGTKTNPYVINNYNVTTVNIVDTTLHARIEKCLIPVGGNGISLNNVFNFEIVDNTVSTDIGIISSANITIKHNIIENKEIKRGDGIRLLNVSNSTVDYNSITGYECGIYVQGCMNITIMENKVESSTNEVISTTKGVDAFKANQTEVRNNTIMSCDYGLQIRYSKEAKISKNILQLNDRALEFTNAEGSVVTDNLIRDNTEAGLALVNSTLNDISNNVFFENGVQISIQLESSNNTVTSNDLIKTLETDKSQVGIQSGKHNNISFNCYWHRDYGPPGLDLDKDGVLDDPYPISDDLGMKHDDLFPLVYPLHYKGHLLGKPRFLSPSKDEKVDEVVVISWAEAIDSLKLPVTYSLSLSNDSGLIWRIIVEELQNTSIKWDTRNEVNGTRYAVKLVAHSEDLTNEAILSLEVQNTVEGVNDGEPTSGFSLFPLIPVLALLALFKGARSQRRKDE